jgi:hypothetical protein
MCQLPLMPLNVSLSPVMYKKAAMAPEKVLRIETALCCPGAIDKWQACESLG